LIVSDESTANTYAGQAANNDGRPHSI